MNLFSVAPKNEVAHPYMAHGCALVIKNQKHILQFFFIYVLYIKPYTQIELLDKSFKIEYIFHIYT